MTYCCGMMLDRGLVLMSDTRTNSGVDNISTFRKMFHWSLSASALSRLMTAGNLATTQAVVSKLEERSKAPSERHNSLLEADHVPGRDDRRQYPARTIQERDEDNGMHGSGAFTASMILAGRSRAWSRRSS
jgi:putative proteasome-type protease